MPPKITLSERQIQALTGLGFERQGEDWLLNLPDHVWFNFNSSDVRPEAQQNIINCARQLLGVKIKKVRILGHTDNVGPRPVNLQLSRQRAESAAILFVASGFADTDVERIGFGSDVPTATNDTREGREKNRRVEIVVIGAAMTSAGD